MNRADTIAEINGLITAVVDIPEHRDSMLTLVNELWQTTVVQTLATGSNVFWYDLRYKKIGNIVWIDGTITSKFSTVQVGIDMVTIPDALFFCKTGQDVNLKVFSSGTAPEAQIQFITSKIRLFGNMSPNQTIFINAHYQCND